MGNALKYIWRADYKGEPVNDLKKAKFYIEKEIERRTADLPDLNDFSDFPDLTDCPDIYETEALGRFLRGEWVSCDEISKETIGEKWVFVIWEGENYLNGPFLANCVVGWGESAKYVKLAE